jgi:hypothetical protein
MLQRRNLVSADDNSNKPTINNENNFRPAGMEAGRGPPGRRAAGVQHLSVPLRRVLARALSLYRDRIDDL